MGLDLDYINGQMFLDEEEKWTQILAATWEVHQIQVVSERLL